MKSRLCRFSAWLVACLLIAAALGRSAAAGEPFVEFLHALHQRGYGEQALAYLDQIGERSDLPAELKRDLVLERAKSLKISAPEAYDAPQRGPQYTGRLAEAKKLMEQFFKDHPDHPEAATSLLDD